MATVTPRDGSARSTAAADAYASPRSLCCELVCTSCRRSFTLDASLWIRSSPYPSTAASGCASPPAALKFSGSAPQVVFDVSPTAPPPDQSSCWIQLSREACVGAMFSVGELTQQNFPVCQGCWATRMGWQRVKLDEQVAELNSVLAVRNPTETDLVVGLLPTTAAELVGVPVTVAAAGTHDLLRAEQELDALRAEEDDLDAQLAMIDAEAERVAGTVNLYLAEQFLMTEETERRIAERRRLNSRALALSRTVATYELFRLDVSGPVGTVNGLRVGRLPSAQTPPGEINQGCGYLLHALSILVRRHSPPDLPCELRYNADQSTIVTLRPKREVLDFFVTQKFFAWKTFAPAWVSFAAVLKALIATLRAKTTNLEASLVALSAEEPEAYHETMLRLQRLLNVDLPEIADDRVGGNSVRYGEATDHVWTTGVKNVLVLMRWCFEADDMLSIAQHSGKPSGAARIAPLVLPLPVFSDADLTYAAKCRPGCLAGAESSSSASSPVAKESFGEQ